MDLNFCTSDGWCGALCILCFKDRFQEILRVYKAIWLLFSSLRYVYVCMCVCVCVCIYIYIYIYIYLFIYLFSLQSFIPVLKLFCKMLYTFPVNKWFSDEVHLTIKVIEYWNPVLTYLTLNCKEYYVVLPNIVVWLECVPCVHHSRLLRWIYRKTDFW